VLDGRPDLLAQFQEAAALRRGHGHPLGEFGAEDFVLGLFLPIVEFNQGAAKRGTTAVALAAMVFLLLLGWRVRRRGADCRQTNPSPSVPGDTRPPTAC
jgi:hypothetical protein